MLSSEGIGEMAVAGEAQVHPESAEVLISTKQVQGARQSQSQLIAVQRHPFHLLEHLREVHGGDANLNRYLSQRPTSRRIRRQYQLGSVDQLSAADACPHR